MVATSVLCVSSISSSPTAAYGHYAKRDHLSSLMVTIIYDGVRHWHSRQFRVGFRSWRRFGGASS